MVRLFRVPVFREMDRRVLGAFDGGGAGNHFGRRGRRALAFVPFAFGGEDGDWQCEGE